MQDKSLDLKVVAGVALVAMLVILIDVRMPLFRLIVGVPLVLMVPGYALMAACTGQMPGWAERVGLSLGLSLVVAVLGGFVLYLLPWEIEARSWALLLGSITLGSSGIALRRRRAYPVVPTGAITGRISRRQGVLLGLAALICVGAVGVARLGVTVQHTSFTQFWMLPISADDVPSVQLGIQSWELTQAQYRLQVTVGTRVIQEWTAIDLAPGQQWETVLEVSGVQDSAEPVVASLYRQDNPTIMYRQAVVWVGNDEEDAHVIADTDGK